MSARRRRFPVAWRLPAAAVQGLRLVLSYFLAEQRRRLWLGMLMAALTVLGGLALLGVAGWFITATAIAGASAASAAVFNVFGPSSFIRFLAIERTVARYGERLVTHDATLAVLAALRERLFRGWAQPQAARRLLAQPARLLFRLTADIDALDSLYLRVLVPFGAALFAVVVAGAALAWVAPWLALALVLWLVLVGLGVPFVIAQRARRTARLAAYSVEALRARTVDLAAGQVELLMAGRLAAQCEAVRRADAVLARADADSQRLETRVTFAHDVATAVALSGTLLAGATLVQSAAVGAPMVAFALLVVLAAFEPFTALRRGAVEFGRTLLAIERIAPRIAPPTAARLGPVAAPPAGLAVRLAAVRFAYPGAAAPALANVDLEVPAHARVALVGASGAGKSTLLALVAGEAAPQSGSVAAVRHSMLTQRTELFQDSVRGNLLLAAPRATDAELWQALDAAGLGDAVRALCGGLDARLGEGGLGLSGGQARRLALARLLLRRAPLWLLDEPTEGLDAATAHDVLVRLGDRSRPRAMLIATHLRREADLADMVVLVDQGQMVARYTRGQSGFIETMRELRPD